MKNQIELKVAQATKVLGEHNWGGPNPGLDDMEDWFIVRHSSMLSTKPHPVLTFAARVAMAAESINNALTHAANELEVDKGMLLLESRQMAEVHYPGFGLNDDDPYETIGIKFQRIIKLAKPK
jgi:hypothetical protein